MRQDHALGTARRAAGIEQPRRLGCARLLPWRRGRTAQQLAVIAAIDVDELRCSRGPSRVDRRRVRIVGHEAHAGAGIVEDERGLARMQADIDRDRAGADRPARVQQFDVLRAVLHQDADAVAGAHAERLQSARQREHAARQVLVVELDSVTLDHGDRARQTARGAVEGVGEVQQRLPFVQIS